MTTDFQPAIPFKRPKRLRTNLRACGFSLAEMIWVIAGLGVLAGLAISQFGGISDSSKEVVAREKLEMLNQGLTGYASAISEITSGMQPVRADTADEQTVLLYLEYRDPTNPSVGSPYVDPRYRPVASSSSSDYRLQWVGGLFKLLTPGQAGSGLLVPFDGSDLGTPYAYPPNFRPLGR